MRSVKNDIKCITYASPNPIQIEKKTYTTAQKEKKEKHPRYTYMRPMTLRPYTFQMNLMTHDDVIA